MRAALERFARRTWSGDAGWGGGLAAAALSPVAGAYRLALAAHQWRARGAVQEVEGLPVISVGNLAVGGTGKTPVASWLVRHLASEGHRPALLSRGYGRDEVLLHRRWTPDALVLAQPDRVRAARDAQAKGATVAVLDDGFQHLRLARQLDIVLLAAEDRFPGPLLPRGPYREPAQALGRADVLLVTRRAATQAAADGLRTALGQSFPEAVLAQLRLEPRGWLTLAGDAAPDPGSDVLAVSAVARGEAFAREVANAVGGGKGRVDALSFPDHHEYSDGDIREIRRRAKDRTVVVTEKDAVKLMTFQEALGDVRVLAQGISWEHGLDAVLRRVTDVAPPPETS